MLVNSAWSEVTIARGSGRARTEMIVSAAFGPTDTPISSSNRRAWNACEPEQDQVHPRDVQVRDEGDLLAVGHGHPDRRAGGGQQGDPADVDHDPAGALFSTLPAASRSSRRPGQPAVPALHRTSSHRQRIVAWSLAAARSAEHRHHRCTCSCRRGRSRRPPPSPRPAVGGQSQPGLAAGGQQARRAADRQHRPRAHADEQVLDRHRSRAPLDQRRPGRGFAAPPRRVGARAGC